MDFQYTPEQEAFRQEVRSWLEANITPDLCVDDAMDERVSPNRETFERRVTWQKKLHAAGWVGLAWRSLLWKARRSSTPSCVA